MKIFVFAIGGTGARALRALSFCLASGMYNVNKDVEFVPVIIDYDATNGDKTRAVKAMEDYITIHDAAYEHRDISVDAQYHNFFLPRLSYLRDVAARDEQNVELQRTFEFTFNGTVTETNRETFANYLQVEDMTGNKFTTAELLRALYNDAAVTDPDYAYTELNLDMDAGFKGNPNIGTVVFDKMSASPEFRIFSRIFDPSTDRVFLIGSLFGGTGSSGIPQMIKAIRSQTITGWSEAKIGAAFVMPYFKVDTPQSGGAVNSNIFKSKQKAALDYYLQRERSFNLSATYYVADQDSIQTTLDYHEGLDEQRNNAHIVELLTALSILDFATKPKESFQNRESYEYGISGNYGGRQNPIQLKDFGENSKQLFINPLIRFSLASKYFKDYLRTSKRDSALAYFGSMRLSEKINIGIYSTYNDFIDKLYGWLEEMNRQEHPFHPIDTKSADLDTMVVGYKDDSGFLSDNADFKGFNSICNSQYQKYHGQESINKNEYQLFFKLLHETSIEILKKFKVKKQK